MREWLEYECECEWSSALEFTTSTQPFFTGVIFENVKMSSEKYCFFELEKDISLEMLALHKNILECEKWFLKYKLIDKKWKRKKINVG